MRISDWSSDVCSSDLPQCRRTKKHLPIRGGAGVGPGSNRQPSHLPPHQNLPQHQLQHWRSPGQSHPQHSLTHSLPRHALRPPIHHMPQQHHHLRQPPLPRRSPHPPPQHPPPFHPPPPHPPSGRPPLTCQNRAPLSARPHPPAPSPSTHANSDPPSPPAAPRARKAGPKRYLSPATRSIASPRAGFACCTIYFLSDFRN